MGQKAVSSIERCSACRGHCTYIHTYIHIQHFDEPFIQITVALLPQYCLSKWFLPITMEVMTSGSWHMSMCICKVWFNVKFTYHK